MKSLNRRTFLRGAGGVAVGLPALEIMLSPSGDALADGGPLPCRYLVCFGGFSVGTDNPTGSNPMWADYLPDNAGPGYDIKTAMAPLSTHGVADTVSVVSQLAIPQQQDLSPTGVIPPGGRNPVFHFHNSPMLTGMRTQQVIMNPSFDHVTSISSDQIVAQAIGGDTVFDSLQYRVQALNYNGSSAGTKMGVLSFRDGGQAIAPQTSPKAAYDSLFTGFVPPDPADAAQEAFDTAKRRSVLDVVDRHMGGLRPRLSKADQQRLDKHYTELRALEELLSAKPPEVTGECEQYADPGPDPALGSDEMGYGGINEGWSDETTRGYRFADLMHMAFTCDRTRVGTLMYTWFQSWMNAQAVAGVQASLHEVNHGGPVASLTAAIEWHTDQFAYLIKRLRDTAEGDGTVLDNCAIVYLHEGGHGFSLEDSQQWSSHSSENMACLVAGGAGGLTRGQHIIANGHHPAEVLLTAMNAVGVPTPALGEVSGTIPGLL